MTADYDTAIDEIFGLFKTTWDGGAAAIVGSVPTVYWPGVEPGAPPPAENFWARVSQRTVEEPQITLSSRVGGVNQRRFRVQGLLFVQIFCPMAHSDAITQGRQLATLVRNAYRGATTASCVEFFNPRIDEVGPDDVAYQINVVVEYRYDDVG